MSTKIIAAGVVSIDELRHWDNNPRKFTDAKVKVLAKEIKDLGLYKPLLVTQEGIVVGGNARLEALKSLGEKQAWVSIVKADNEADRLFFALSDNDMVGKTEKEKLMELLGSTSIVDMGEYSIDFGVGRTVKSLIQEFDLKINPAALENNETIEKVIFTLNNADFEEAMVILDKAREKLGIESNSELIIHLVSQAYENIR